MSRFARRLQQASSTVISSPPVNLTFTLAGIHPEAAAQSVSSGMYLNCLAAYHGKIYAGYGDWSSNTGPMYVDPYDPITGTFVGKLVKQNTEAINIWRQIGDLLYSPDIDPIAGESSGGYAVGEPWTYSSLFAATHIFDMNYTTTSDLWLCGSLDVSGVTHGMVWHSTDTGQTWSVALDQVNNGYRIPAIHGLNGIIYTNPPNGGTIMYEGTAWQTAPVTLSMTYSTNFNGKLVFPDQYLPVFDGTTLTNTAYFGSADLTAMPTSLAVEGSYLYALTFGGKIARSQDLVNWEQIGTAPADAGYRFGYPGDSTDCRSIAVLNGYVYLGGPSAKLYKSTTAVV